MRYSTIIVGADGSESALKAVEQAAEIAGARRQRAVEVGASDVTATLVNGDPGQALLTTASEQAADLIVVGNRGINTLSGRLLGSVPSDVSNGHRVTSSSCIR